VTSFVLDASVAIKWVIPDGREPLMGTALRLLQQYRDGELDFIVPDVFWAEVGNALWRGVKQGRWNRARAGLAAEEMRERDFQTVPSRLLVGEALEIASTYDRNIYDCLYAALAVQARTELITADERLANALAARFPVKWLGAF